MPLWYAFSMLGKKIKILLKQKDYHLPLKKSYGRILERMFIIMIGGR
jgi:hypothetical protein